MATLEEDLDEQIRRNEEIICKNKEILKGNKK